MPPLKSWEQKLQVRSKSKVLCLPLHLLPPKKWAKHLSHPSSLTPGHTPTITPYKEPVQLPTWGASKRTCYLFSLTPASVLCISCSVVSDLCNPMECGLQPARPFCPWDFPGRKTRVRCHPLFQGTLQTQGSNPGLLHRRQILYHLNHLLCCSRGPNKVLPEFLAWFHQFLLIKKGQGLWWVTK